MKCGILTLFVCLAKVDITIICALRELGEPITIICWHCIAQLICACEGMWMLRSWVWILKNTYFLFLSPITIYSRRKNYIQPRRNYIIFHIDVAVARRSRLQCYRICFYLHYFHRWFAPNHWWKWAIITVGYNFFGNSSYLDWLVIWTGGDNLLSPPAFTTLRVKT